MCVCVCVCVFVETQARILKVYVFTNIPQNINELRHSNFSVYYNNN